MGLLLMAFVAIALPGRAALTLPVVISDHMVLQRDKPVALWGWADAGQTVTVEMLDQTQRAVADAQGRWQVSLEPLAAGGPHVVTIVAGDERITLEDVLVGEVWLCSGQSNMDMRLNKVYDADAEVAGATHETIRLFRVERDIAATPQSDLDTELGAHWVACNPDDARNFSAAAYFMAVKLQEELGVPVGMIHTAYGGTPAEAWPPWDAMDAQPEIQPILARYERQMATYEAARVAYETAQDSGTQTGSAPTPPTERYAPAGLYNAMIHPLVPYTIRGFAWYQGESNVWRAHQYEPLLATMIAAWRTAWQDDALPFGIVQIAAYSEPPRSPRGDGSFPELRESQRQVALADPHAGLIVTTDIGDATDIHPRNKQEVGRRLAIWALHAAYEQDILPGGPVVRSHRIEGNQVIIDFDHVGTGFSTSDDGPIRGFCIAGPDAKFRWAVAEVIDHDTLSITEAKVPSPIGVRYAWSDNPDWANLVNSDGLPASAFRTDDLPFHTE